MAQTLGELVFDLVLNDKQFHDKLRLAQARLKYFADAADFASKRAAASFRGMGSTAGDASSALKMLQTQGRATAAGMNALAASSANTQTGLLGFANAAREIDTKLVMAFTAASVAVTSFGTAVTVTGARLENTLNKVAVVGGGGLDDLTAAAKRFGTTSEFSAQQAADAMLYFAQAGFDAGRNIAATEASIALASASGSELAQTTSVVSNAISQFGLNASDAERISNTFAYALNASKLGMDDLAVSMKYAGTVGAGFGFTLEETTAAIMQLADLGLTASKSGTVFRLSMTSAANATQVAQKVLAKYGLTQADINPTTQKFAGILQVVADNNINVADAMKIFGMEAGANIVQLAKNAEAINAGTRAGLTYTDMLNGIGKAQRENLAGTTAEQISQTVALQFKRLTSAVQSLAADLYTAYSTQLLALVKEFLTLAQTVADTFRYSARIIGGDVASALQQLTVYLQQNRTSLAGFVIDFINGFGRIFAQLSSTIPVFMSLLQFASNFTQGLIRIGDALAAIIPLVDTGTQLLIGMFVVARVYTFTNALMQIPTAFKAAQWAARAFGVELTALSGGTYALVIAGGALLAYLISLVGKSDEATRSVDELAAAQERQRKASDAEYAKQVSQMAALLSAQQARVSAEVNSGARLSAARKQEIQQILSLTAEQALYEKSAGRLVVVNGELISASAAVAKIQSKEAGSAGLLRSIRQAQIADNDAALASLTKLREAYASVQRAVQDFQPSAIPGAKTLEQTVLDVAKANGVQVESFDDLKLQLESAEKAYRQSQSAAQAFNNQMTVAKVAFSDAAVGAGNAASSARSAGEAQSGLNESLRQFTQIVDEAIARYDDVVEAYRQGAMSEAEIEAERLDRRIQSDNAIYDAAMIAAAKLNDATVDWAQRRLESEAMLRATYMLGSMQDADKMVEEQLRLLDELTQTEEQKKAAARAAELQRIKDFFAAERQLHIDQGIFLKGLAEKEKKALDAAEARYAEEDKQQQQQQQQPPPETKEVQVEVKGEEQVDSYIKKFVSGLEKVKGALAKIRSAVGLVGKALGSLTQLVTTISGFSFDFLSMLQQVVSEIFFTQREAADEAARQAAAAGFDPEAARRRAMEANKPEVVAEQQANLIADRAVAVADIFSRAIGPLLSTLAERLPDIINAVAEALPRIVTALSQNIGPIVTALLDSLMVLVEAIFSQLPDIVMMLVDLLVNVIIPKLPEIVVPLVMSVIDLLFTQIIPMLPEIAFKLIAAAAKALLQWMANLPKMLLKLITSVWVAFVGFFKTYWTKVPVILFNLVRDVVVSAFQAIREKALEIAEAIANAIANFFGIDREARQARREDRRARREERRNSFYSGIDYVPATMRATLHQGEAVIPADRNAQRSRTSAPAPAGYAQNFGGGPAAAPSKVEVAVIAEGRLLEAVQLTAQSMGRANGMSKKIRRAAGVQVGFFRGQFNPFSV